MNNYIVVYKIAWINLGSHESHEIHESLWDFHIPFTAVILSNLPGPRLGTCYEVKIISTKFVYIENIHLHHN